MNTDYIWNIIFSKRRYYEFYSKRYKKSKKINELTFKEDDTFLDIRRKVEDDDSYMVVTLPNLFWKSKAYCSCFDFIYNGNNIIWNPTVDETTIKDFIGTYNMKTINVYLVPRDSGDVSWCPDPEQTLEIAKNIVSFLWNSREAIGLFASFLTLYDFFAKRLKKINSDYTNVKAENFIYSIIIKDDWELNELMKIFKIKSEQEAIAILILFGYRYSKKNNKYHITKKQRNIISDNIRTIVITLENEFLKDW